MILVSLKRKTAASIPVIKIKNPKDKGRNIFSIRNSESSCSNLIDMCTEGQLCILKANENYKSKQIH